MADLVQVQEELERDGDLTAVTSLTTLTVCHHEIDRENVLFVRIILRERCGRILRRYNGAVSSRIPASC
jgi:hypothetical protein